MSASLNLSIRLQAIAQALEDTLNEAAGEPCAFVLPDPGPPGATDGDALPEEKGMPMKHLPTGAR